MNVIWVVPDMFRRDRLGAYGNEYVKTPTLAWLASRGSLVNRH